MAWHPVNRYRILIVEDVLENRKLLPQLIVELIHYIPETQATLTNALTDLVNNFPMDIIIEVTQAYLE